MSNGINKYVMCMDLNYDTDDHISFMESEPDEMELNFCKAIEAELDNLGTVTSFKVDSYTNNGTEYHYMLLYDHRGNNIGTVTITKVTEGSWSLEGSI